MYHIAFVHSLAANRLLNGTKTTEMRLSKVRHPARLTKAGDRLVFKLVGGQIFASALITAVHIFEGLKPVHIAYLAERFSSAMGITPEHPIWQTKVASRYGVFLEFFTLQHSTLALEETPRSLFLGWQSIERLSTLRIHTPIVRPLPLALLPR